MLCCCYRDVCVCPDHYQCDDVHVHGHYCGCCHSFLHCRGSAYSSPARIACLHEPLQSPVSVGHLCHGHYYSDHSFLHCRRSAYSSPVRIACLHEPLQGPASVGHLCCVGHICYVEYLSYVGHLCCGHYYSDCLRADYDEDVIAVPVGFLAGVAYSSSARLTYPSSECLHVDFHNGFPVNIACVVGPPLGDLCSFYLHADFRNGCYPVGT
jgi:hypothetical protein